MTSIPLDRVIVRDRMRPLNERAVAELSQSIDEVGLMHAIAVTEDGVLVSGLHRLEACRRLGWSEIPARTIKLDDLRRELGEIDENLIRNDLTVLERGQHLKRRKDIYETLHPETRTGASPAARGPGGGGKASKNPDSGSLLPAFVEDASAKTSRSRTVIAEEIHIAKRIAPDVQKKILGTPLADNKTELKRIARLDGPAEQRRAVIELLSAAPPVKTASAAYATLASAFAAARTRPDLDAAYTLLTKAASKSAINSKEADELVNIYKSAVAQLSSAEPPGDSTAKSARSVERERSRTTVLLLHKQGKNAEEIAEELGVSPSVVSKFKMELGVSGASPTVAMSRSLERVSAMLSGAAPEIKRMAITIAATELNLEEEEIRSCIKSLLESTAATRQLLSELRKLVSRRSEARTG